MLSEARGWFREIPDKLARTPLHSWDTVTQAAGLLLAQQERELAGDEKSATVHTLPARMGMAYWLTGRGEGFKIVYTKQVGLLVSGVD